MVGLSEIPCVWKLVDRISDATVEAFFRGLRYLFCYKELVNVLNSEIEKVSIQQGRVSKKSVEERADGKIIEDQVLRWQTEVEEIQESAKEFSEKYKNRASWTCLKCLPIPKPVSRFRLGREAVLKATKATELIESGKELLANEIAHLPPTENLPKTDAAFQDFTSRKGVYGKLWEALVNEDSSLILGIYGMPGVGKTRMMAQIWQEAMEKKIFKKVARANVGSEKLDVITLQNQIAGHLDCHFVSQDNVESRASQLKNCLMNGGKILLIFDDVWSEIPLDNITGTSFGESSCSKGSKILFTSRSENVCLQNNCKHPVQVTTLTDKEAWDLFQDTVGTLYIDSLQDETLAKEVCKKCAGLPLLIRAVGKALRFMSRHIWKDALQKLEKGNFENIAGIDPQVYACIKLSIDRLPEETKLCLLLCSLFPEDADIHITTLIQFAIGSQLISDGEYTVRAMVDILTISSLLLECREKYITKLHDIIRDVARSIAFTDSKYSFLQVRFSSRLPEISGYSTVKLLRLDVESDHALFSEDLICTDINTLWLHCNNHLQQFSGSFFSMFVNLGFLILQNVHFLSEHFSLQSLRKLNMLIFDNCDIRETDASLFPKNLRTLCIWACNLPSPLDLPNLKYLRKLDIQQELLEVIMVPNAISSLSSLEELHIPNGYSIPDDARDITLILDEMSKLTRLTSLKIFFNDFEPCQGTSIFFKLLKYDIYVGGGKQYYTKVLPVSTRIIKLENVIIKRDKALQSLMERAEELSMWCTDVDVSSILNSNTEAFTDLKDLSICSCEILEYISRISQDEIQHTRQSRASFSKLTILVINGCSAMKYLFGKSVANCLVQLQNLRIIDCPAMEAVVMNEGAGDGEIINFSKLKGLILSGLQSLRSFYGKTKEMSYGGSTDNSGVQFQPLFDGMVAFPSLEGLTVGSLEVGEIWGKHYFDDNKNNNNIVYSSSFSELKYLEVRKCSKLESVIPAAMLHRLRNLEYLYISECSRLRNVFPPCIARDLIHLEKLYIIECVVIREIIGGGEQQEEDIIDDDYGIIVFPELRVLRLFDSENLTSFWCYQNGQSHAYKVKFPALLDFFLKHCGQINLEAIEFTGRLESMYIYSDNRMHLSCFRSLQQLKSLVISGCGLLEEIVEDVKCDELAGMVMETIALLHLDNIFLKDLPNLKSFIHGTNYECYMPALKMVDVHNCGLSSLSKCSVFGNLQQLQSLAVSDCRLLEDIVEDQRIDETSDTSQKNINFFQLSLVTLKDLPNLRSFSRGVSYAFNMPKLCTFILIGCPQVEYFTFLKTSTRLVSVHTEGHEGEEVTDLNDFIIQNRKRGSNLVKVLENEVSNHEPEQESGTSKEEQPQEDSD